MLFDHIHSHGLLVSYQACLQPGARMKAEYQERLARLHCHRGPLSPGDCSQGSLGDGYSAGNLCSKCEPFCAILPSDWGFGDEA